MSRALFLVSVLAFGCTSDSPAALPDVGNDAAVDSATDLLVDGSRADAGDASTDSGARDCEVAFLAPDQDPFQSLSEWCLFTDDSGRVPNDRVHPFEVASVLYADDSSKERLFAIPPNTQIEFSDDGQWGFPVGSILIKSFYYPLDARVPDGPRHMLETRLIVLREDGWEPYIYIWNDAQTEAHFERLGEWIEVQRTTLDGQDESLNYRVPNTNQCRSCHAQDDDLLPLGPRTRQLNIDVEGKPQLEQFEELELFTAPLPDLESLPRMESPEGNGPLEGRARSYLEANCAHCHNPDGAGGASGLNLGFNVTEPADLGICKRPVAAGAGAGGLFFDIVPGAADQSIMVFRMKSVDPEIKMPELPTQTSDAFGVELISDWINAMTQPGCPE